jgi:hypothetical protein
MGRKDPTAASAAPSARERSCGTGCAQTSLEVCDAREQLVEREKRWSSRQAYERHLQRHPRLTTTNDVVKCSRESLKKA